jgi:hypothetical protein
VIDILQAMFKNEMHKSPQQDLQRMSELEQTIDILNQENTSLKQQQRRPDKSPGTLSRYELGTKQVRIQPKEDRDVPVSTQVRSC